MFKRERRLSQAAHFFRRQFETKDINSRILIATRIRGNIYDDNISKGADCVATGISFSAGFMSLMKWHKAQRCVKTFSVGYAEEIFELSHAEFCKATSNVKNFSVANAESISP